MMPHHSQQDWAMERSPRKDDATLTRALLACGVVAGPLFILVGVIQMFTREGFDIRRHALSLLSAGDLGWIQSLNFLVTGVLLIAGAVGVKRALQAGQGRTWGPLLLGVFGAGMFGAGIFRADPALGFPPGTPDTVPISVHGILHFAIAGIGFLGFIAASFVFARRFSIMRQPGWAWYSLLTGLLFFVTFAGIASGSKGPFSLYFFLGTSFGLAWIAMVLVELGKERP
jgi:hypothetical membrane protein